MSSDSSVYTNTELLLLNEFREKFGGAKIDLQKVPGLNSETIITISNGETKCFYELNGKLIKKINLKE